MIYDNPQVKSYIQYKKKRGPFIFIFYYPYDIKNKEIFFECRKISEEMKQVPIFRFDYKDFTSKYKSEIKSHNDILIIEKDKSNIIESYTNYQNLYKLFEYIADKRLKYKNSSQMQFINKYRFTDCQYVPLCLSLKGMFPTKKYIENDEIEYIFPNSYAMYPNEQYLEKQRIDYLRRLSNDMKNGKISSYKLKKTTKKINLKYEKLKKQQKEIKLLKKCI